MDLDDEVFALQEQAVRAGLKRLDKPAKVVFTGFCKNCSVTITAGEFCDAECRDDFEWATKKRC